MTCHSCPILVFLFYDKYLVSLIPFQLELEAFMFPVNISLKKVERSC